MVGLFGVPGCQDKDIHIIVSMQLIVLVLTISGIANSWLGIKMHGKRDTKLLKYGSKFESWLASVCVPWTN